MITTSVGGPLRAGRGSSWWFVPLYAGVARRFSFVLPERFGDLGLRLMRRCS